MSIEKKPRKILTLLAFLVIVIYAFWNGRNLILGPQIQITSPQSGETVQENPVTITGTAQNVSFLTLQGHQIFIDKEGKFKEPLLLNPGENTVEIYGKDRFNKEKTVIIYLYNKATK